MLTPVSFIYGNLILNFDLTIYSKSLLSKSVNTFAKHYTVVQSLVINIRIVFFFFFCSLLLLRERSTKSNFIDLIPPHSSFHWHSNGLLQWDVDGIQIRLYNSHPWGPWPTPRALPFDRHSRDQKATNIRTLRHPYNMTKEGETSPLDDGGQRQGTGPTLNLHIGMKSDHRMPQICRRHFHPKAFILLSSLFVGAHVSEP